MIHSLLYKSLSWILNKIGSFTLISLILLFIIFSSLSYGLQTNVPMLMDYSLLSFTALGLITGWILAKLQLAGWKVFILSTVIGTLLILIDLSHLLSPILNLSRESINVLSQTLRWPWNNPPDVRVLLFLLSDITNNINEVLRGSYQWIQAISSSQTIIRSSGAILFWLLTIWATSIWAGWAVRRIKKPIISITPAGILLASTLNYVREETYLLVLFLLSTLSLTAFVHYHICEKNWEVNTLDFPEDIRIDYTVAIGVVLFILSSLTLITPSISLRPLATSVRRALSAQRTQIDIFADSLGLSDPIARENLTSKAQKPGLPRSHLLGSKPELSRNVVMIVNIEESEQTEPYWRGLTYDNYDGRGWSTSEISGTSYDAGDRVPQKVFPSQQIINQGFHITRNIGGRLLTAGMLLKADKDFQVAWRSSNDMFGALIDSPTYQVSSLVNQISETQLRSANQEYPDWILTRYLNLPHDLPNRVIQLASDLTAGQSTAYDKTLAIETFLRSYPYTLDIPLPPEEQDVSDYFLFDLKKGYCDYYATSMVILARATGLPARLVVGYGSGLFDTERNRFIVTEADAHSWVEIYFPDYGWIEFEPTGGRSPIARPTYFTSEYLPYNSNDDTLVPLGHSEDNISLWRFFPPAFITIISLIIAIKLILDDWSLRKTEPAKVVKLLYQRIYAHGQNLDIPMRGSDTPNEFSTAMKKKIGELMDYFPPDILTPKINRNLNNITDLYIQMSYSPHPLRKADQSNAIQSWHQIRFWFLIARLTNIVRRIYRRIPRKTIQ